MSNTQTIFANFRKGVAYAILSMDEIYPFENQPLVKELIEGGKKPDFTRGQTTYSFQYDGKVEVKEFAVGMVAVKKFACLVPNITN